MPRRSTAFIDLMLIPGRLPMWAGLIVAAGSFVAIHLVAGLPGSIAYQGLRIDAGILQYVFPVAFLLGTLLGLVQRRRVKLVVAATGQDPGAMIANFTGQDIERLLGASFEAQGYRVTRTGGSGPDGGVDFVLMKDRTKTLVQCKRWRSRTVGVNTVRTLFGMMAARSAGKGIIATVGEFTTDARDFANGRHVELLNGEALTEILCGRSEAVAATPATPRS